MSTFILKLKIISLITNTIKMPLFFLNLREKRGSYVYPYEIA